VRLVRISFYNKKKEGKLGICWKSDFEEEINNGDEEKYVKRLKKKRIKRDFKRMIKNTFETWKSMIENEWMKIDEKKEKTGKSNKMKILIESKWTMNEKMNEKTQWKNGKKNEISGCRRKFHTQLSNIINSIEED
jgi:hypothetical protein